MEKTNKYRNVRTMEDLDAALHHTREAIATQGETVRDNLVQVREYYTPKHLALNAVRKFALDNHLYTIAINAVSGLKRLFQK